MQQCGESLRRGASCSTVPYSQGFARNAKLSRSGRRAINDVCCAWQGTLYRYSSYTVLCSVGSQVGYQVACHVTTTCNEDSVHVIITWLCVRACKCFRSFVRVSVVRNLSEMFKDYVPTCEECEDCLLCVVRRQTGYTIDG